MSCQYIVAVVGASTADQELYTLAERAGRIIADNGWCLLNGGLSGVMEAASKGANERGGVVVGILPTPDRTAANPYVTIPIATNMGHARNIIIAHSSDALLAIGGGEGTLSEIAIARKLGKPVASVKSWEIVDAHVFKTVEDALNWIKEILKKK